MRRRVIRTRASTRRGAGGGPKQVHRSINPQHEMGAMDKRHYHNICAETGYADGPKFENEKEVREYLSKENLTRLYPGSNFDDRTCEGLSDFVIHNRLHMKGNEDLPEIEEIERAAREQGRRGKRPGTRLLTKEIARKLPKLYATESVPPDEKVLVAKFFTPDSSWTWYAAEFDGKDTFFGYVEGHENEWGYFSLRELESARGLMGLKVERDLYWEPRKFKDLRRRE